MGGWEWTGWRDGWIRSMDECKTGKMGGWVDGWMGGHGR